MSSKNFNIIDAVRYGYLGVWHHRGPLLRSAWFPMGVAVMCQFIVAMMGAGNVFAEFLLQLPAVVTLGWYLFIVTRLLLLGEDIARLDPSPAARRARESDMRAFVISFTLLNMGAVLLAILGMLATAYASGQGAANAAAAMLALAILTIMIWGLRLYALPILVSIGYPVKKFLYAVNGAPFSFSLIATFVLCPLLPVMMVSGLLLSTFIDTAAADPTAALTKAQVIGMILLSAPLKLATFALMTAATLGALHQVIGGRKP